MPKENFEQNLIRIWDGLRTEYKGSRTCAGVNCHDCPLNLLCNPDIGATIIDAYRYIEIVENWAKEHPVATNAMKFKEIFGTQPSEISSCNDFWDKEYKEQESSTGSEQECHEIHKRYGKGMTKEVKGFSSAYPSMCDLKIIPNVDGTWLTIRDNASTLITIRLADLNNFIRSDVSNNKESEE